MADLSQVQIDFTYRDIIKWDRETTRKNFADPQMRPLIDEVLRRHQAEQPQAAAIVTPTPDTRQAEAIKQQSEKDQALAQELIRFRNLTPAQQEAEMIQRAAEKKLKEEQSEKEQIRDRVSAQKKADYLNAIGESFPSAKARSEEVARRHQAEADRIAAEEKAAEDAAAAAEAERVAAETKAAEEKAAADKAAEEKVAADKAAEEKAAADKAAEEKAAAEKAAQPKQKFVIDFQAEDENGHPIGRRTHLEADTQEELTEKMKTAYINAIRYAERMKKRAAAPANEARPEDSFTKVLPATERAALEKDLEGKDETKKTLAQIKIEKDNLDRTKLAGEQQAENIRRDKEAEAFVKARPDFYPCEANAMRLFEYIDEKKLVFSRSTLEEAFEVLEHKLAQRPVDTPPAVPEQTDEERAKAAEAAVEAAKAADEAAVKAQAEAAAKTQADLETKLRAEIETKVRAEFVEAQKKLQQEQAAANTAPAQASVAPAAPAAGSTSAEKSATTANTAVVAPKLPAGGIEPGTLHGGRPSAAAAQVKTPEYTKQDIKRMSREEMRKRMRDPKFVKIVEKLFAPQQ